MLVAVETRVRARGLGRAGLKCRRDGQHWFVTWVCAAHPQIPTRDEAGGDAHREPSASSPNARVSGLRKSVRRRYAPRSIRVPPPEVSMNLVGRALDLLAGRMGSG